jgi:phage FluMu protein Com
VKDGQVKSAGEKGSCKEEQMNDIRCVKCGKLLGKINGEYEIKCPRCKELNTKRSVKNVHNQEKTPTNNRAV